MSACTNKLNCSISDKSSKQHKKYLKDTVVSVVNFDKLHLDALQGVYLYENKLFTGKAITFHRGTTLLKKEVVFNRGIKDGMSLKWFLNGQSNR